MPTPEPRIYHPDLPDHLMIWIGAHVALSTGYGGREHWTPAEVIRFTKTQVVLAVKYGATTKEQRWNVSRLTSCRRETWPTYLMGGNGRGESSTRMVSPQDPQVLGSKMHEQVSTTRSRIDRMLDVRPPRSGYRTPVEDFRVAMNNARKVLTEAMLEFEALAAQLPEGKDEI